MTQIKRNELLEGIKEIAEGDYCKEVGQLRGTLSSVLIALEVYNPELYEQVLDFELAVSEMMLGKLKEDKDEHGLETK